MIAAIRRRPDGCAIFGPAAGDRSNWYETDSTGPFPGIRGCPDQQQIFDGSTDVEILGHDNYARTRSCFSEAREITGHRLAIVGKENSRRFRGNGEHLGIGYSDKTARMSAAHVNGRFPPAKASYDFVVEIGVRLESWPHALGA
jgi:hypothetical protein